jgi:hypothetical protein
MFKAGTIIIAVSSMSVAQATVCSENDKAFIQNPQKPTQGLVNQCKTQLLGSYDNFTIDCFMSQGAGWSLIGTDVSPDCASCIYGIMTNVLDPDFAVNDCMTILQGAPNGCESEVDTIILDVCGTAWAIPGDGTTEAPEDDEDNEENETTAAPE